MVVKITAPEPITGVQAYGPHRVEFSDGIAVVGELPWPVEAYMRDAGYAIAHEDVAPGEASSKRRTRSQQS